MCARDSELVETPPLLLLPLPPLPRLNERPDVRVPEDDEESDEDHEAPNADED